MLATPAAAQTIAITNGRVVVGDGGDPIANGTVVIRNGRVVSAGTGVSVPAGAEVIDAQGRWVTPGLMSGFSRIGLSEIDAAAMSNDTSANDSPFNAALDIAPAINPQASAIGVNRAAGVTRAIVSPDNGRSMFAGQGAVIDLGSDMDAVTRPRAFQFVEFGEAGGRLAGGSRVSSHAVLRNALREATQVGAGGARPDDVLLTRADAAALVPVVQGRQLLLIHVERAIDIINTLALVREFPRLRLVLVGATEGWRVAAEIRAAGVPVIANALVDLPNSFEQLGATQSNIGRMRAAGIPVAIGHLNDDETRQVRLMSQYAGNLVALSRVPGATGLSWGEAFAAISSRPAEAIGMGDELGSLRPGRRADVVIWDGDPLEPTTGVSAVWIDGVRQSLETRQTRLRDRYRTAPEGNLPHAYSPRGSGQ